MRYEPTDTHVTADSLAIPQHPFDGKLLDDLIKHNVPIIAPASDLHARGTCKLHLVSDWVDGVRTVEMLIEVGGRGVILTAQVRVLSSCNGNGYNIIYHIDDPKGLLLNTGDYNACWSVPLAIDADRIVDGFAKLTNFLR